MTNRNCTMNFWLESFHSRFKGGFWFYLMISCHLYKHFSQETIVRDLPIEQATCTEMNQLSVNRHTEYIGNVHLSSPRTPLKLHYAYPHPQMLTHTRTHWLSQVSAQFLIKYDLSSSVTSSLAPKDPQTAGSPLYNPSPTAHYSPILKTNLICRCIGLIKPGGSTKGRGGGR